MGYIIAISVILMKIAETATLRAYSIGTQSDKIKNGDLVRQLNVYLVCVNDNSKKQDACFQPVQTMRIEDYNIVITSLQCQRVGATIKKG